MSNASEDFYGVGAGRIEYTPPTDKQSRAVRVICSVLGIQPPDVCSFDAYALFISEHIEKSRRVTESRRAPRCRSRPQAEGTRSQRDADWDALNLDSAVWAQKIMDGETVPPSWVSETLLEAQRRLRGLGYKTSRENDLEREIDRLSYRNDCDWF